MRTDSKVFARQLVGLVQELTHQGKTAKAVDIVEDMLDGWLQDGPKTPLPGFGAPKPRIIRASAKKKKVRFVAKRWKPSDDLALLRMKKQGHTNRVIARKLGRTLAAVDTRVSNLRKIGRVPTRNK